MRLPPPTQGRVFYPHQSSSLSKCSVSSDKVVRSDDLDTTAQERPANKRISHRQMSFVMLVEEELNNVLI